MQYVLSGCPPCVSSSVCQYQRRPLLTILHSAHWDTSPLVHTAPGHSGCTLGHFTTPVFRCFTLLHSTVHCWCLPGLTRQAPRSRSSYLITTRRCTVLKTTFQSPPNLPWCSWSSLSQSRRGYNCLCWGSRPSLARAHSLESSRGEICDQT